MRETALAYASVLLCGQVWVGSALFTITLCLPWQGASGLAAAALAFFGAQALGFDRPGGSLLFNSLLCGLALGYWVPPGTLTLPTYGALLLLVSFAALAATLIFNHIALILGRVPSMSLPFCTVATSLHWFLRQTHLAPLFPPSLPSFTSLPEFINLWGQSVGAIFFAPQAAVGLAMTAVLLGCSRFHLLHGIFGFAVSVFFLRTFSYPPADAAWLHLNCILTAMAIGGVFFIPSRLSLLMAMAGSCLCAFVSLASLHILQLADAPVLTLPFNLTTLAMVAALRWRTHTHGLRPVTSDGPSPEASLRADRLLATRFPEPEIPSIAPPFDGEWIVTQGFDDEITHLGAWRHALDFELASLTHEPFRPESNSLEDFPSLGAPIIAPAHGLILRAISDVRDNPIGGNNLDENWGNSVLIEIAPQLYVQLSHFRCGGLRVREGERVRRGQLLGYLGNSGRSPFPHLHLQMQTQPEIGAATIPFRLHDYRTPSEKWTYQFRELPIKGQIVAGSRPVTWPICPVEGRTQRYRVFTADGVRLETINQSLEPAGIVSWRSSTGGAELRTQVFDGVLIPISYTGSHSSLLSLFWLAGRLPLSSVQGLQWSEVADSSFLRGSFAQCVDDFAGAYFPRPLPKISGETILFDRKLRAMTISCTIQKTQQARVDGRLELHFRDGLQLVSAHLETPSDWMHVLALDALPDSKSKSPSPSSPQGVLMSE
ncbi:hypothetical protein BH09VER1_BH09VER1_39410 [soil metagenome]